MKNITDYRKKMLSMRKDVLHIDWYIMEVNKIKWRGRATPPFSNKHSYRNGYYGTFGDGESPFIGHPGMVSYFKNTVKPKHISVRDACLHFASNSCFVLNCNVTEWQKYYLHSFAEKITRVSSPINTLTEDELSFDSLVLFTPVLPLDALKDFILEHVSQVLQWKLKNWFHNSKIYPTIPLEPNEVALGAFDFDLYRHVYSVLPSPQDSQEMDKLLLFLKPRQHFCNWLTENNKHLYNPVNNSPNYDLDLLRTGCSAIVIPYLWSELQADEFFAANYTAIFECELNAWCGNKQYWPAERSLTLFTDWFDFDYHDTALALSKI
jgi:hypothetical protein